MCNLSDSSIDECTNTAKELYENLKRIAEEKDDRLKSSSMFFSYYVFYKGEPLCLFTMWNIELTIMKNTLGTKIPREADSQFRQEVIKINALKDAYDNMNSYHCLSPKVKFPTTK